jgi:hypothetical protein
MVTIHDDDHVAALRHSCKNVVDVVGHNDGIVTVPAVHKICREDCLVVSLVLVPFHVVHLQAIARERKEEHVTRPGLPREPTKLLQDVHPRRLLARLNLHGLPLAGVNIVQDANVVRLETTMLL